MQMKQRMEPGGIDEDEPSEIEHGAAPARKVELSHTASKAGTLAMSSSPVTSMRASAPPEVRTAK